MKDFVIFFEEKEGTSPLVWLLNNFEQISIIQLVNNEGWEPFDRHNCGYISLSTLERYLEMVFRHTPMDVELLNQMYVKKGRTPLEVINPSGVVGFKMRFFPPTYIGAFSRWNRFSRILTTYHTQSFKRMMINILKRNKAVVFLAVRQDLLRWGLSKYHGDGTGKPGHIQFKLASGAIDKNQIGKIHINCKRLETIISRCEASHGLKRRLMEELRLAGIPTYPLRYEDFLADKQEFVGQILNFLEVKVSKEQIGDVLDRGQYFVKVHSDDISTFVINHEEVEDRFNDRFVSWR
jgi:hypothetical protein